MTDTSLPRSTPSAEGVSAAHLERFLDDLAAGGTELHSLMVLRHGKVLAEGWWAPFRRDDIHQLYSLSKSFMSTALGFAVAEGLVDLDAPVISYFPQYAADAADDRVRRMTVRHAVNMASGHTYELLDEVLTSGVPDIVQGFLRIPPEKEPGSWFTYNQPPSYTVGAIVQAVTGQTLDDYLRPRLFEPLGIGRSFWAKWHGDVRSAGFIGLHLETEAIAKFGELLRCDGVWQGRRILPEGWVALATANHIPTREPNPDWRKGYGYQFWQNTYGFRGDGAFGQYCIVLPDQEIVIAATGSTLEMQKFMSAIWDHILPGLGAAGDASADASLARRLGAAAIDIYSGGLATAPAPLELAAPAPVEGGWELSVKLEGMPARLACGDGQWRRTVLDLPDGFRLAVESQGRWARPGMFTADVVFVETPHRLTVRYQESDGRSYARWKIPPLVTHSEILGLATKA